MGKKRSVIALLLAICLAVTIMPLCKAEEYEASEKVGLELLELLEVTYEELTTGDFVDSGETYSCIIWLQDVEIEEAVEAGIDAAERTKEDYSIWRRYDYPYTAYEVEGLTYVDVELDEDVSDEYVQTYIEAEREAATELYSVNNNSFVTENFMARDLSVTYVSQYSPCVFANLSLTKIAELVESNDVVSIEYVDNNVELETTNESGTDATINLSEIEEAMEIIAADRARENYDVTGTGVKIGQIEPTCPDVSSVIVNPNGCNTWQRVWNKTAGKYEMKAKPHANNVYLIMSTIAPGATYYSTGFYNSNSTDAASINFYQAVEWLLAQGVNVINMSAGYYSNLNEYDARSRWVDHITFNHDVHFVKSAGNKNTTTNIGNDISSPGMAYNIITVGATKRTFPYEIADYSSYNSDGISLEDGLTYKPDVVAPGTYTSGYGTSYSTPLVSATIALMCEYQPALKTKQHAVKAILAASTGKETGRYVTTDAEFSQYGAGMIDARAAIWVVSRGNYSSHTGSLINMGDNRTYSMKVTSSDTCMRVALAYANYIKFATGEEHTEDNLPFGRCGVVGLSIYSPTGERVLDTAWFTRGINMQVVEFDPRTYGIGTYTIKVYLIEPASGGRTTNFGVAWR